MNDEEETVVEAPAHVVVPSRHEQAKAAHGAKVWTRIAQIVGVAIILGLLGSGLYLMAANAGGRVERLELIEQLDEAHVENAELRDKVDALYEQVLAAGEDPVVEPSDDDTSPPSLGPTGPRGEAGRPPTAEEVIAGIGRYCANGACTGTPGGTGPAGNPGESIVGPAGPPGTNGADGTPGAPGADGVSIVSVTCVLRDDLSTAFRFTFSSGVVNDVTGMCAP